MVNVLLQEVRNVVNVEFKIIFMCVCRSRFRHQRRDQAQFVDSDFTNASHSDDTDGEEDYLWTGVDELLINSAAGKSRTNMPVTSVDIARK